MFKIWAKIITNDKIVKSFMYKGDKYDIADFRNYLTEICDKLDIPTPVLLKSHFRHFESFGTARFLPSDFVEHVDFDSLVVEYCKESAKKNYIYKAYLPVD